MAIDDLDGFEMKPITTGLGFQKKQGSLKASMKQVDLVNSNMKRDIPTARPEGLLEVPRARSSEQILGEIKDALKPFADSKSATTANSGVKMTGTLPRNNQASTSFDQGIYQEPRTEVPSSKTPTSDPLANINFRIPQKEIENKATQRGASDALIREWKPVPFSITAAFLDAVIVMSLSLIFLVGLISATNVDVLSVMLSARTDIPAQLSLVVLYLAMSQMYLIVSRSFAGSSIGEWTFDIQVGQTEQIPRATYPLKVLLRSFFTLITGILVLPLLSVIFRKDLAGFLSGARLYKRNY